jgi:recombination protein RecT
MPTTTVRDAAKEKEAQRDQVAHHTKLMRDAVKAAEHGFAMALPAHVTAERFMRAAFTALNTVPRLAECTQQSVLAGLMQAAQLGLEVSDVRGQAYLIPRRDKRDSTMKASFQLGYRGMIDLAARSGITVDAEEIHERDEYDYALGTTRYLRHKPPLGPRGKVLGYYATAVFADHRQPAFTLMSVEEVEEHRDRFASARDSKDRIVGPWSEHFDAMARKTVIRQLLNYLPVSVELRDAAHRDAIETTGTDVGPIDYGTNVFALPEPPDVEPLEVIETDVGDAPGETTPPDPT